MQQKFLQQAHADLPVYLTDVYRDFQKTGTRPFHLRLTLYDGTARSFPLQLLPDFFLNVSPFLPATHVLNAMRAASMGVYQNDFWIEIASTLLFLLPFIILGILRPALSKLTYWFVEQVEKSKLVA